ncbi:MAG: GNAT family N-acetyltransferase [Hungatella sp.]|nr:GNAT family N-acetyltransferase [Hungatella sp.]
MNHQDILRIALEQSACDLSCRAEDFLKDENVIVESLPSEGARRYLALPHICNLASYGNNIVACGRKDLLPDIEEYLKGVPHIENCFETPGIYPLNRKLEKAGTQVCFMAEYFLPDMDQLFGFESACDYEMRVLRPEDFKDLYTPEWSNALCRDRRHLDVIGVGAYDSGSLVGLAGCSADCDSMWQIGVDVLPGYRRQGIACALTNRIAKETLERGRVPFYCAAWSNVRSVRNAIKSGFKPAWVEATAKPVEFVEGMIRG